MWALYAWWQLSQSSVSCGLKVEMYKRKSWINDEIQMCLITKQTNCFNSSMLNADRTCPLDAVLIKSIFHKIFPKGSWTTLKIYIILTPWERKHFQSAGSSCCLLLVYSERITIFSYVGMTICHLPGFKPCFLVCIHANIYCHILFCVFVQILFSLVFVRCEFKQPLGYLMTF